jgi:hypothetical protein
MRRFPGIFHYAKELPVHPRLERPGPDEYAPYYERYIALIGEGDVLERLESQRNETTGLLGALDEKTAQRRYAPGKWSVKEVLGHVIDTERVFAYRALRFSRNDPTELPGFSQDAYAPESLAHRRPLTALLNEFNAVRESNLHLFESFSEAMWLRRGIANEEEMSVRGLVNVIAGHEHHHVRILRERYLRG